MSYQLYKVPLMTFMSIICIVMFTCTEIVIEMMRIFNKPI